MFAGAMNKLRNTVLNLSEAEAKVMDACTNEKWGPSGTLMHEICAFTKDQETLEEILTILFMKLEEPPRNWRMVYKTLNLIEFMVGHASEKCLVYLKKHRDNVNVLKRFKFVDTNGKDEGLNVRKKAEKIYELLGDPEGIKEARALANKNKNKYTGVSNDTQQRFSYTDNYSLNSEGAPRKSNQREDGSSKDQSKGASSSHNQPSLFSAAFADFEDDPAPPLATPQAAPAQVGSEPTFDAFSDSATNGSSTTDAFDAGFEAAFDAVASKSSAGNIKFSVNTAPAAASTAMVMPLAPPPSIANLAPPPPSAPTTSQPANGSDPFAATGGFQAAPPPHSAMPHAVAQTDPFMGMMSAPPPQPPVPAAPAAPVDPFGALQGLSIAPAAAPAMSMSAPPPPQSLHQPTMMASNQMGGGMGYHQMHQPAQQQDPFAAMQTAPPPPPTSHMMGMSAGFSNAPPMNPMMMGAPVSPPPPPQQPADPFADILTESKKGGKDGMWGSALSSGLLNLDLSSATSPAGGRMAGAPMRR